MKLLYTILLSYLPLFLFAQTPTDNLQAWNETSTFYVAAIPPVGEKVSYQYNGLDVADFDLNQMLLNHPNDVVKVYGSSINNGILTFYRFDSSTDDSFSPCGEYAPMLDCQGTQAFLGVKTAGDEAGGGAIVVEVKPNTGAEASDLVAGDLILAIDDDPIINYTDLSKEVRKRAVGQDVVLSVDRAGAILEIEATLGTRSHQTVRYIPYCNDSKLDKEPIIERTTSSSVFPNPTAGPLTWNLSGLENGPAVITLTDLSGKLIVSQKVVINNNGLNHNLDVSNLMKGSYFLNLQQADNNVEEKIVVVQ